MAEGHEAGSSEPSPALPPGVRVADDVLWQQVDGQVVLLELNAGRYYSLDPVGSRIWEALVECPDISSAQDQLLATFEVDETTLRRDIAELINDLTRSKLLVPTA
jgi:hypothetical protein